MEKYYHELKLKSSQNKPFIDLSFELGCIGLEEKDGTIILRSDSSLEMFKFAFETMQEALKLDIFELSLEKKENKDWVEEYKASVSPIQVGGLYVHTSWQEGKKDLVNIVIDPALAFGSGHHASTNACLVFLCRYLKKGMEVLDLGCGSGILGISAAKLGGLVDACDIDEIALKSTHNNAKLNNVSFNKTWLGSAKDAAKTYDLVLVNIIADIILLIKADIKKLVGKGGHLILSGLINERVAEVIDAFCEFELIDKIQDDEWTSLTLKGK